MNANVINFDILRLELTAETGAMESGTQNSSLIGVHVERNLVSTSSVSGILKEQNRTDVHTLQQQL